jgi:glycosyltransferase involved in cell wall biosynthesis
LTIPNQAHFSYVAQLSPALKAESVVAMAVYYGDRAEWVSHAIDSILNQTYTDFIFFIAIDGDIPSDLMSTLNFYARADERIILTKSSVNLGLSSCINYIVDIASQISPQFLFRMDADDISCSNRLQKQVDYLSKNPLVSVLGSSLTEIDENDTIVGHRKLPETHQEIVEMLPKRCPINHPTVVFRFDVFRRGFRYQDSLRNTQDYFMWIDLVKSDLKFANLPDELLQFRRVNDFYKRRGFSKSINEFRARVYAMSALRQRNIHNVSYASAVFFLRLFPSKLVKLAYRLDRYLLAKRVI